MTAFSIELSNGTLTGERRGSDDNPLVLLLPGFSQDERCFDFIAPQLTDTHQVLALALRGRGNSTSHEGAAWGPRAHAQDVLELARKLGRATFSVVGWSFGGLVAMHLANLAPDAVERVALLDACGTPDAMSLDAVRNNQVRLTQTFATADDYVEHALAGGLFRGHEDWFRPYLAADLVPAEGGGWRTRTTSVIANDAVLDTPVLPQNLWLALTMPTLLLRAAEPITPEGGFVVPAAERDAFLAAAPGGRSVEIAANHGTIGVVQQTVDELRRLLA